MGVELLRNYQLRARGNLWSAMRGVHEIARTAPGENRGRSDVRAAGPTVLAIDQQ